MDQQISYMGLPCPNILMVDRQDTNDVLLESIIYSATQVMDCEIAELTQKDIR